MNKKFTCVICNYSTDVKFAFEKHLNSNKHIIKSQELKKTKNDSQNIPKLFMKRSSDIPEINANVYECPFCNNTYSSSSNLTRHKKLCSKKEELQNEHNIELKEKDQEIQRLKELYEKDTTHLKELHKKDEVMHKKLEDEVKYLKSMINNAGAVIKTSVSALSYIAENYDGAPVLKKLKDYSYIKEQEVDEDDTDDEFDLIGMLIYHDTKETLNEYLGNIIVEAYKKKDPKKQSIWNSDTVRLNYIIRDLINKKPDWTVDKKGVKTTKYIIDPLLEYIRDQVTNYVLDNTADKFIHLTEYKLNQHAEKLNNCGQIIASIDNKSLSKSILKYIAPHFYLAKSEQLLEQ